MANNEQTNLAVINTNQTPNEPYIFPFDSESGMLIESWLDYFNKASYKRDEKQKTRLCIDYRKLNAICKTDAEPLPRTDSLLDKLNSAKIFSTLGLASGYWHIPLHDKDKEKLAFVTTEDCTPTDQPFEYISVDTVGGFNNYNSTKKFLHLIIDHATRYVWAFASKSETTETYANCLKQLFQIQIPSKLLTDRNGAFTSSRFKRFLRNYNVKQLLTTSHHPQTNGKCERVNQSIVAKLRCKVNSSPTKIPWTKFLEQVINEYNLTPHSVTKFPPAYLLFGTLPYTSPLAQNQVYPPVEEARKLAKENTRKYHEKNKIKYDARFIDSPFEPGDLVIYEEFNYPNRRKLSPIFSGSYEIVQNLSDVNYEITKPYALTKKPTEIVHVSKLRTYYPPEELNLSHE
ncbi:transposon Tf2-11 polyprotein [Trichonephila clavipes]|nr:transposon Tf2-11 polyprotein [Trichonephila clavipes]